MSVKFNSALGGSVTLSEPNTASAFNLTLPTDNIQPGMNLITPTSVAGTGVTFSGGSVSFNAAPAVSVNNCFTATYSRYRVLIDIISCSAVVNLYIRLRASSVDATATYFMSNYRMLYTDGSLVNPNEASANVSVFQVGFSPNTQGVSIRADLFGPQLAQHTRGNWQSANDDSNRWGGGVHKIASAYDGITLLTNTAETITGNLCVYGLRN